MLVASVLFIVGIGACILLAGNNDAFEHRVNVFRLLLIRNLLFRKIYSLEVGENLVADGAVLKSEELLECIGIDENLLRCTEFNCDVFVSVGYYGAYSEGLVLNLKII